MTYQSINPYNGALIRQYDESTDAHLEWAMATAATCFSTWRTTTFAQRAAVVSRAAAIMRARLDDFARPVTEEMGKLIGQARGEVQLSADILDYYAENGEAFLKPVQLSPTNGHATVESAPIASGPNVGQLAVQGL